MFRKLKRTLVETYVGAFALGWLFAQSMFNFVDIFVSPVSRWIGRLWFNKITRLPEFSTSVLWQDALPSLVRCLTELLIGYLLLRWLYYKPIEQVNKADSTSEEVITYE